MKKTFHSSYICIECKNQECEKDKKGGYKLYCPSCCGPSYYRKTPPNRKIVDLFSKDMIMNPRNNYITHLIYD